MLKPERVWKVGDKFFDTHQQAREAAKRSRQETIAESVMQVFGDNINWEGWTGDKDDLMSAVQELLKNFNITRKKF